MKRLLLKLEKLIFGFNHKPFTEILQMDGILIRREKIGYRIEGEFMNERAIPIYKYERVL